AYARNESDGSMRVFLALVLLFAGCQSTGGKLLGALTVASAIGSGYLVATDGTTTSLERGRVVLHEDNRLKYGAALGVASMATIFAWLVVETAHRERRGSGGGGYGGRTYPASDTASIEAPPAIEAAPRRPSRDRRSGRRSPYNRGWHLDPADHQHKLYDRDGFYVGRFDAGGDVWTERDERVGRVNMGPECAIVCRRSQARKALLGDDLVD
ncbi:MAG TPA: hypothetical protein VHP64_00290, partial [Candidatus Limnocylindria bacterium]|nr:hypothetical protein [Candidatus Limnocylindria bacterium]